MIVYEFIFNDNTYKSRASTISIHETRKGAEMALEFHKQEYKDNDDFDERHQYWNIRETELKD